MPYLDFLRYSIDDECPVPASIDKLDWHGLYDFAAKQAIIGVIYHGIKRLPEGAPRPDTDLELQWFGMAEAIRKRNMQLNMVAAKLQQNLAKAGFRSCILKGQGNALMYPDPYMRQAGDIDVWLDGSKEDIIAYAKKDVDNPKILYHHVEYPIIKDIDIELHFFPSYMLNPWSNARMQKYFESTREQQFNNEKVLPQNAGVIFAPTVQFNFVMQLSHMLRHYLKGGLGLRHLIDFYFLMKNVHSDDEVKSLLVFSTEVGFRRFPLAVFYLLETLFGTDLSCVDSDLKEKAGTKLLKDMIEDGNLGKSNPLPDKGFKKRCVQIKRLMHKAYIEPSEIPFIHYARYWQKIKISKI